MPLSPRPMQCSSNSNNDGGQQNSQLSLHFSGCGPMGHFWMCGLLVLSKVETWNDNHGRTALLSRPSSCRAGHGLLRLQWETDPHRVWLGRNCERSGFSPRLCQQHLYGLVEIGGFRRYNELSVEQNRHMYKTEQANLTTFHVMGGDRYMRLVAQHSTGIHGATDTTDQAAPEQPRQEQGEESEMEVDPPVEDVNSRGHILNRLRTLINGCLSMHEYQDAAAVQQLVLMVLDRGSPGVALSDMQFHRLFMDVVEGLDTRFRRSSNHSRSHMAGVFQRYVEEFETQLGIR